MKRKKHLSCENWRSLSDLTELSQPLKLPKKRQHGRPVYLYSSWKFPFGKHKGESFLDVAIDDYYYIKWCYFNIGWFKAAFDNAQPKMDKIMDYAWREYIKKAKI